MEEQKELVTITVQRKDGDDVVNAIIKAGATGATFFHARGTGVRQKLGLLGLFIEAEKQVIMVVVKKGEADKIIEAAKSVIDFEKPGTGFAFVQTLDRVIGFYQGDKGK